MDLGMPTLLEFESLAENAHLCRMLGFNFVEINMNLPAFQLARLRALSPGRSDIYYTLHLDENLNPFDFNTDVAMAYSKTAREAVRLARENGMPIVNMHFPMGVYFTLPGGRVYLWDRYWEHLRDCVRRFRDDITAAAGDGVRICIENTAFGKFAHHAEALDILLESPAFALTYDCGHDRTDGMRAWDYYARRSDRLRHMHLHDSTAAECHLPLGSGDSDISAMLSMAKDIRAVIEVKDAQSLSASAEYINQLTL
jgi:sugar phosphate isomerase/epimerase